MINKLNALIEALYDGSTETPLWSVFLEKLQVTADAVYAGIFFRSVEMPKRSSLHLYSARNAPYGLKTFLEAAIAEDDPADRFKMDAGKAYRLSDLSQGLPADSRFDFGSFDRDVFRFGSIVRVVEPSGLNAWLVVARQSRPFPKRTDHLLETLSSHLGRALGNHIALERGNFISGVASEAMQRLDYGWISLDKSGSVIDASPYAYKLLQNQKDIIRKANGSFSFRDLNLDRRFRIIFDEFNENPTASPRPLRVSRDPWLEVLLVPVQQRHPLASRQPIAIVYLHGDTREATDREQQIVELFGLLPSEARMALALARGLSIAEAADDLGLTEKTARSYSKQIYAKMGARGQADVVRFLITSILSLA